MCRFGFCTSECLNVSATVFVKECSGFFLIPESSAAYSLFGLGEFISSEAFCFYLCLAYFDFYHVHICYDQRLGIFLSEI